MECCIKTSRPSHKLQFLLKCFRSAARTLFPLEAPMFCFFNQKMDAIVRKADRHLEHEPEWETGITLLMRLIPVLKPLYKWCSMNVRLPIGVRLLLGICFTRQSRALFLNQILKSRVTLQRPAMLRSGSCSEA